MSLNPNISPAFCCGRRCTAPSGVFSPRGARRTASTRSAPLRSKTPLGTAPRRPRDETLRPEMRLVEDLELDSLKTLTLALEVENHFRVCLDEEAEILTVGDLAAVIQERHDE